MKRKANAQKIHSKETFKPNLKSILLKLYFDSVSCSVAV